MRALFLLAALCLAGCSKGSTSFVPPEADDATGGRGATLNCRNGDIDPDEDCEPGDLNGGTCESLRFEGGILGCDPRTCTYDTSMCTGRMAPSGGSGG